MLHRMGIRHDMTISRLACLALLLSACAKKSEFSDAEQRVIETLSPLPEAFPAEPTNRYADDPDAATLGQMFFFEQDFSGPLVEPSFHGEPGSEGNIACASCHTPDNYFTDIRKKRTSMGATRTAVNNLTLVNANFNKFVYWNGPNDSYWAQAAHELESLESFNSSRLRIAHVVYEQYRDEYNAIFDPDLDEALDQESADAARFPPVGGPQEEGEQLAAWEGMTEADQEHVTRIHVNVAKSIQAFERKLISRNAPFDRFAAGEDDAISAAAKRGLKLFMGKAACIECHSGPTFADDEFHNLGMPQNPEPDLTIPAEATGRYEGAEAVLELEFNSDSVWSDDRNTGRLDDVVVSDELIGQWRTQSLRHVTETGPYGHAGQYATLREMIEFYNVGGGKTDFPGTKDDKMVELNLSEDEIDDLVSFMETLTGERVPEALTLDTSK
jgi:cytochrome c peroxidase